MFCLVLSELFVRCVDVYDLWASFLGVRDWLRSANALILSESSPIISWILGVDIVFCMVAILSLLSNCSTIASAHWANNSTGVSVSELGVFMPIRIPLTVDGRWLTNSSTKMRSLGPLYKALISASNWDGLRFPSSTVFNKDLILEASDSVNVFIIWFLRAMNLLVAGGFCIIAATWRYVSGSMLSLRMAKRSSSSVMLLIANHDSSWSTEVSTNFVEIFPGRNLLRNLCEPVCCVGIVCSLLGVIEFVKLLCALELVLGIGWSLVMSVLVAIFVVSWSDCLVDCSACNPVVRASILSSMVLIIDVEMEIVSFWSFSTLIASVEVAAIIPSGGLVFCTDSSPSFERATPFIEGLRCDIVFLISKVLQYLREDIVYVWDGFCVWMIINYCGGCFLSKGYFNQLESNCFFLVLYS